MELKRASAASSGLLRLLSETGLPGRLIIRILRGVVHCASVGLLQVLRRWDNAPSIGETTRKTESGIRREDWEGEIDPVVGGSLMCFG